MNVKAQSCLPKGRVFWLPSPEPPPKTISCAGVAASSARGPGSSQGD